MTVDIRGNIKEIFAELNADADRILSSSIATNVAFERITELVNSELSARSRGLCSTIVSRLTAQTQRDPAFQSDVNINKFFDLGLLQKISVERPFKVTRRIFRTGSANINTSSGKSGISGAIFLGLGCAIVLAIILKVLCNMLSVGEVTSNIVVVIGAIFTGAGGFAVAMMLHGGGESGLPISGGASSSDKAAVRAYLKDVENDMHAWATSVENYYNQQVNALKARL